MTQSGKWIPYFIQTSTLLLLLGAARLALGVDVYYPPTTPATSFVSDNFFGISFELSIMNTLVGNHPNELSVPIQRYLQNIRSRMSTPLRLRIGGNSMDSSTYVPTQGDMIIIRNQTNTHDIAVTYGPLLLDSLVKLGDAVGGSQWLVSLSLINIQDIGSTVALAVDATAKMGDRIDAFLLGNEPDLYFGHQHRVNVANYTVQDYMGDFGQVLGAVRGANNEALKNAPMAGPTICCGWDLATMYSDGFLNAFGSQLKYITLQHYPQNLCFGTPQFGLDQYLVHANTVQLALWNEAGIRATQAAGKSISMTEFNSAACGGVPGVSNTFGALLWTIDYALQLAARGYMSAYIHTREANVTYNLFDPPLPGLNMNTTGWSTGPPYHALLFVAEALHNDAVPTDTVAVTDLNINGSVSNQGTVAAYAIYPNTITGGDTGPMHLVLLNTGTQGNQTYSFVPTKSASSSTSGTTQVAVKYLRADSVGAQYNISWANQVMSGFGELQGDIQMSWVVCSNTKCDVQVPSPGAALVYMDAASRIGITASSTSTTSGAPTTEESPQRTVATVSQIQSGTRRGKAGGTSSWMAGLALSVIIAFCVMLL